MDAAQGMTNGPMRRITLDVQNGHALGINKENTNTPVPSLRKTFCLLDSTKKTNNYERYKS